MFLGTYTPRLDDKGRLVLPAKWRDALSDGVVLTRGQESCLYVYPVAEYQRVYERLRQAPTTSRQVRDFTRLLHSGASDEVPDRQGRITVPPVLRRYASLERECAVIGAGARVEVWDAAAWEAYLAVQEERFSSTAEEIVPGLL